MHFVPAKEKFSCHFLFKDVGFKVQTDCIIVQYLQFFYSCEEGCEKNVF